MSYCSQKIFDWISKIVALLSYDDILATFFVLHLCDLFSILWEKGQPLE